MYSHNYHTLNSAGDGHNCIHTYAREHADILCNSNNLIYHYKFVICIYQKYEYDMSQLCIPRWCLLYYSNMPRAHFNPNAFEVSKTNIVLNIYTNVNKFLPNTIIFLLDKALLIPIIIRKKRSKLFFLYYGSYLSKIALVIHLRWCLFTSQMDPRIA